MKLKMIMTALSVVVLTAGISSYARADWRGHRHGYRPSVAVRIYAPMPRVFVPPVPVVVNGGYGFHRQRCAPRYNRGCGNGYGYNNCSGNYNNNSSYNGYYNDHDGSRDCH